MLHKESSTWLEIDLGAIRHNIHLVQAISKRAVMAVIKANGYGHGLAEVGRAAESAGAAWCGVARIDEALLLRQAGIALPLLVLGFCPPERVAEAISNQISLSVFNPEIALAMASQARQVGQPLQVHAKIDTGMGRLGMFPQDAVAFMRFLSETPGLTVEGIFTHFARADEPQREETACQIRLFDEVLSGLQSVGLRPPMVHAANSAAALYFPQAAYDMVRPGIAIYGLQPSADAPLPAGFRPALTWKARLVSVKELPANHGVGYNHRYVTARKERIGVVAVGYADGIRRRVGNFALVGGKCVPMAGGVCMDQCMVHLDGVPEARAGDEVVLIGQQGQGFLSAEVVAESWGTINYEVVCGLQARVPRYYFD